MNTTPVREQLNQQLNELPDDIVAEIADFTAFVLQRRQSRRHILSGAKGSGSRYRSVSSCAATGDDVEYTVEDAEEVYGQ